MEGDAGKTMPENDAAAGKLNSPLPALPDSEMWTDDAVDFDMEEAMVEELMKLLEDDIEAPQHSAPAAAMASINGPGDAERCESTVSESDSGGGCGMGLSDLLGPDEFPYEGMEEPIAPDGEEPWELQMDDFLLWQKVKANGGGDGVVAGKVDDEWLERVLSGPEFDLEPAKGLGF